MAQCKIKCLNCGTVFNSPIQFGNAQAFFTSTLIGNAAQCPHCLKMTGCNKDNMIFSSEDSGKSAEGFVGKNT